MWHSASYTDMGKVRTLNEDSLLDLAQQNLWLVADGMGGHSNGDYASQLVAKTLSSHIMSASPGISKHRMVSALEHCNTSLMEKAELEQAGIIGCTVALLQARENSILCSWSGDSRIYRVRNSKLMQLTQDHSRQSAVEDRDCLRYPDNVMEPSQILTHAIGGDKNLFLEHCWYQVRADDTFLLCTDGLNKEVSDDEIRLALCESRDGPAVLKQLADQYQQRGARDNVGMVWVYKDS